jgi:hypothetical protein
LRTISTIATTLKACVDHQADDDVSTQGRIRRHRIGGRAVGQRVEQCEADQFVVCVHGMRLGRVAPDVGIGERLEIRCDESLLI